MARVRGERSGNGYHLEGHRRQAASRIHTLIGNINRNGREQVEELDAPSQYRAWIEQELSISEEAEARLRQNVSDADPNAYLNFWLDRMLETAPAD